MRAAVVSRVPDSIRDVGVPQPAEWQRIGDQTKPRLSLRGRISYSWIEDFKNQPAQNAVQSRWNFRRFAGWLSVAL
jgi:hypothetical protein